MKTNPDSPTGGTFNWGGISFNISGNTYFINNKVGYHGEGKMRMTPNWYTLGYTTEKTKCHYYKDFINDTWLYENASVSYDNSAKESIKIYSAACT